MANKNLENDKIKVAARESCNLEKLSKLKFSFESILKMVTLKVSYFCAKNMNVLVKTRVIRCVSFTIVSCDYFGYFFLV